MNIQLNPTIARTKLSQNRTGRTLRRVGLGVAVAALATCFVAGSGAEARASGLICHQPAATSRGVAQAAYVVPKTGAWAGACIQKVANLPGSSTQAVNFTIGTFDSNRNDDVCVVAQMWLVSQPAVAGGEGMFFTQKYQTSREMGCGDRVHNLAYLPASAFTHYQTGVKASNVPGRLASIALRVCAYDKKNTSTTLGCSNWNTWWLVGDAVNYANANTPGALGGQGVHTR